jgi:serine/threonine-protein kinase RsbW
MGSDIVLTVPAQSAYVTLARAATAAACAQADFPLDRLDDIRLAVDEACALVIADAPSDGDLQVVLTVEGNHITVVVRGPSRREVPIATNTFAWTVLTALVDEVSTQVSEGSMSISLQASGVESVAL